MYYAKIKTDKAKAEEIKDFYQAKEITDEKLPYEFFLVKKGDVTIHAYRNKKEIYTIVFSSEEESAVEEARYFDPQPAVTEAAMPKKDEKREYFLNWEDHGSQIGSDEVGVGDFFGPLIVTATYITREDIAFLEKYQINDSKKMKDPYILSIGPTIKRRIKNYVVMVSAKKLSDLAANHFNIHKAMAKCHNIAQMGLMEKYGIDRETIIYVDQFTPEKDYRKLVGNEIVNNPLYFRTKGESFYPSVAAASVIARYTFLKEWEEMEKKLGTIIPKGAGAQVDSVYHHLKSSEKKEALDQYVKRFFSNYER